MKRRITALVLLCACLLSLAGCSGVSQEEYDQLNAKFSKMQADFEQSEKDLSKTKSDLKAAQEAVKEIEAALEGEKKDLQAELTAAQTKLKETEAALEELKNGPAAQLAAIRTAYDKADWKKVISLAKTLHSKYPGYNEDVEGQKLAAAAQKTIDDEAAKAAAEAAKSKEQKVHELIRITRLSCSSPNSADGVGIYLEFLNMHPTKTIKYLEVTVRPKNAVGDTQYCDIRDYANYTCEATGPYAPGKGLTSKDNWWWPNAWYNSTIKTVELVGVSIDYMDGSWVTLKSDELPYAIW